MRKTAGIVAGALGAAVLLAALLAQAATTLTAVHFPRGGSGTEIEGSLVRGDRAIYSFSANAGQTADIAITALEDNASFALYQPPASVTHSDDGLDVNGTAMAEDTKQWSGALPASGAYYVEVGGDRGNASFTLTISVK